MGDYRFVADVHLAKLAKYLRLLGIDTLYFTHIEDSELIDISNREQRWILTKDRELSQRAPRALLIKSNLLKEQLREVLKRFEPKTSPFSRCLKDNAILEKVEKKEVLEYLPPKVKEFYEEFWRCGECGRIYWHGSHYEKMKSFIDEVGG